MSFAKILLAVAALLTVGSIGVVIFIGTRSIPDRIDATCSCSVGVGFSSESYDLNSALIGNVLVNPPQITNCSSADITDCEQWCIDQSMVVTNNCTLSLPPKSQHYLPLSVGQYLCDTINRDVSLVQLKLISKVQCTRTGGTRFKPKNTSESQSRGTGRAKFDKLTCKGGKYLNIKERVKTHRELVQDAEDLLSG